MGQTKNNVHTSSRMTVGTNLNTHANKDVEIFEF